MLTFLGGLLFDIFEKKNDKKNNYFLEDQWELQLNMIFQWKTKNTTITFRWSPKGGRFESGSLAIFDHFIFFSNHVAPDSRARAHGQRGAHGEALLETYLHLESIDFMAIFDCHIIESGTLYVEDISL